MRNPARDRPGREHALAVLILPVVALGVIFAAVIALQDASPRGEPAPGLIVQDVPPLVLGGDPTRCIRGTSDDRVADVRREIAPRGRVSAALVDACPAAFDGLETVYVGEVIGHLLERDGGVWVQVNDDGYALRAGPLPSHDSYQGTNTSLAVWLPSPLADRLTGLGGPGRRGDVVSLTGTIRRTDPEDGGGLTFRADDLRILAPSVEVERPLHVPQAIAAGLVSLIALVGGLALRRARRHAR